MKLHTLIQHMINAHYKPKDIANILDIPVETVHDIIIANVITPANEFERKRPSALPNSYYIDRLKKGYTVKDIANELDANLSGIYRLLKQRGISTATYQPTNQDPDKQLREEQINAYIEEYKRAKGIHSKDD